MKVYGEVEIQLHVLNTGTRWRWKVIFTLRPLYPRENAVTSHWIWGIMGPLNYTSNSRFWNWSFIFHLHYRAHNSLLLVPILRHVSPVRISLSYSFKIHFNLIFCSTPSISKRSFSFRLPHLNFLYIYFLPHACHKFVPFHPSSFVHQKKILW